MKAHMSTICKRYLEKEGLRRTMHVRLKKHGILGRREKMTSQIKGKHTEAGLPPKHYINLKDLTPLIMSYANLYKKIKDDISHSKTLPLDPEKMKM